MPPSTAAYSVPSAARLIDPTRYSVVPAGPAIERPGSTTSSGIDSPWAISASVRCAQIASIDGWISSSMSPGAWAIPSPPPRSSTGSSPRPCSSINATSQSTAAAYVPSRLICDPRCTCRPAGCTCSSDPARSSASSASGAANPNLEPWWPVLIFWWVSASMPGVTRTSTCCTRPAAAARRSTWSSSPMWSTTTSPHPASIAADRSASDLLLPWTITDSAGAPARSAAARSQRRHRRANLRQLRAQVVRRQPAGRGPLGGRLGEPLACGHPRRHPRVRLTEGHALAHQLLGQIGRDRAPVPGRRRHPLTVEAQPAHAHRQRRQRPGQVVDLVEAGPLVLLQVAVVRQRQPLEGGQQPGQPPDRGAGLAPHQLRGVRVLLLRHHRAAGGGAVVQLGEAVLGRCP